MFLKIKNNKTLRVHTAVTKRRQRFKGGYTSFNDTHPSSNFRFITSSKGKRPNMKPKMMNHIKDVSTASNFSRIYTPQHYSRFEKTKNKNSKTKTMLTSEMDSKQFVDPMNISTQKVSDMTLNSSTLDKKHKFRLYSAHPAYFSRLTSGKKYMKSTDCEKARLTSLSSKDWKIFSVQERRVIEKNRHTRD
jgi:hypothetical protein